MKTDGSDQNRKDISVSSEKSLKSAIASMSKEFERSLPGKIGADRMMRIAMTAILRSPQLAQCEQTSFFGALLQALQLGLEVNTPLGQAYLIPRQRKDGSGNTRGWECNFQLGYQGLLDLCYRYGRYKRITAEIVYEGDYFEYQYGSAQRLTHIPKGTTGKQTHVWALYELENGGERFMVWTWEEAMRHGESFSDAFTSKYSPWSKNDTTKEEMAKKSVLKSLLKYAPKSVEMADASYVDGNTVIARKIDESNVISFDIQADDFDAKEQAIPAVKQESAKPGVEQRSPQKHAEPAQTAVPSSYGFFSKDEEDALEAAFNGSQGVEPPDFS